ncbi:calmodulin-binding receptor-like cytoplasmic kinase 2 [Typha angustifolia]|uniref:calmodulin-binding receptor-like cytoplasmic kinase 2 n=1 Tax=Typha angustifolia TaxID=59011 RepID=UPI003C2AD478
MQLPGNQQLSFSHGGEDSGISHGLPLDPHISQISNFSATSLQVNQGTLRASRSLKVAAQKVAGVFTTCFVPHRRKSEERNDQGGRIEDFDISSTSTSKVSTVSSNSSYKFRNKSHDSSSRTQQQTTGFSAAELYKATSNFSDENKIGQGGFGTIYKAKLKDGSCVAVKRAKKNMYDKHLSAEFSSEVQTLSNVEHLNLVRFLGYLECDDERLIVVEYVGNGTLREHLDGSRGDSLELTQRLNIAIDVAHAITYLHGYADHPIIHRDIKASNILLTDAFRAKVADFGFARLASDDPEVTHVSTQVKGTAGYVDPEYLRTYQLTDKSDVYSFGVVLVELITGRRPIERGRDQKERLTTQWAIRKFKEGDAVIAMDARLRRTPASIAAVEKMLGLAQECLAPSRRSRPTMKKCAEELWAIRRDYQMSMAAAAAAATPDSRKEVDERIWKEKGV